VVDLMDAQSRAAFAAVWPPAKFPVLRDDARGHTIAEASVIVEYLDAFHPGPTRFVPSDPDAAWAVRMWDRVIDHYVHEPMQKIVVDNLRPEASRDALGVEQAKQQIRDSYTLLEDRIGAGPWAMGSGFSLVDCAAAPALFYANVAVPFGAELKNLPAYLERLTGRPSVARVLREAEPYFQHVPLPTKPVLPPAARPSA
jgi:glutathione S-transferase